MQPLELRNGVRLLVGHASRDLSALWRQVTDAASAQTALRDVLPAIIDHYGIAASSLAANWYDDAREKAGVGGHFRAITPDIRDSGTQALIGWAGSQAKDDATFQGLILGGTQRRIANFSRGTITGSSVADPKAHGWQREGSGECEFCLMLVARGAVYSEATADFAAHDNCNCTAVPAFDGEPRPVRAFTPSTRDSTPADRARVRAYIADH